MSDILLIALVAVAGFLIFWGISKAQETVNGAVAGVGAQIDKAVAGIGGAPAAAIGGAVDAGADAVRKTVEAGKQASDVFQAEASQYYTMGKTLMGDVNTSVTRVVQTGTAQLTAAQVAAKAQAAAIIKPAQQTLAKGVTEYKAIGNTSQGQAAAAGISSVNPLLSFSLDASGKAYAWLSGAGS